MDSLVLLRNILDNDLDDHEDASDDDYDDLDEIVPDHDQVKVMVFHLFFVPSCCSWSWKISVFR